MTSLAVSLMVLVLFAAPLVAEEQPVGRVPRVGYLGNSPDSPDVEAFRQALRALGRVKGEHVMIQYRWSEGKPELFPVLVADFIRLGVDVIYMPGSVVAARAAKQATTTIPIVFSTPADPVEAGLVMSLARPDGNLTGLADGGVAASKHSHC